MPAAGIVPNGAPRSSNETLRGRATQTGRVMTGRFAPSPTGDLHVGNLRTALLAWLMAREEGRSFLVRMEDLDQANSSLANAERQLADLHRLGLEWDGEVVRQSERFARYEAAIEALTGRGSTYECFCTRREIRDAVAAPHSPGPELAYPGTCRNLTSQERAQRRRQRPPALRLRAEGVVIDVDDAIAGPFRGTVDDVVLRRNDGVPAYNLAVVVDDAAQGVTEVVRGADLLTSTPRQLLLAKMLELDIVTRYAHVPLVVGDDGQRLAKRHGAVTLGDLAAEGVDPRAVLGALARSLGMVVDGPVASADELLAPFAEHGPTDIPERPVELAALRRSWGR